MNSASACIFVCDSFLFVISRNVFLCLNKKKTCRFASFLKAMFNINAESTLRKQCFVCLHQFLAYHSTTTVSILFIVQVASINQFICIECVSINSFVESSFKSKCCWIDSDKNDSFGIDSKRIDSFGIDLWLIKTQSLLGDGMKIESMSVLPYSNQCSFCWRAPVKAQKKWMCAEI